MIINRSEDFYSLDDMLEGLGLGSLGDFITCPATLRSASGVQFCCASGSGDATCYPMDGGGHRSGDDVLLKEVDTWNHAYGGVPSYCNGMTCIPGTVESVIPCAPGWSKGSDGNCYPTGYQTQRAITQAQVEADKVGQAILTSSPSVPTNVAQAMGTGLMPSILNKVSSSSVFGLPTWVVILGGGAIALTLVSGGRGR